MRSEPCFFWFSSEKALLIVFSRIDDSAGMSSSWARDDLVHVLLHVDGGSETIALETVGDMGVILAPLTRPSLPVPFDISLTVSSADGDEFRISQRFDDTQLGRDLKAMTTMAAAVEIAVIASMADGKNPTIYAMADLRNDGVPTLVDAVTEAITKETLRIAPDLLAVHMAVLSPRDATGALGPAMFQAPPGLLVSIEVISVSRNLASAFMPGRTFLKDLAFSLSLRVLTPDSIFRFEATELRRFRPAPHGPIAWSAPGTVAGIAQPEHQRSIGSAVSNDVVMVDRASQWHGARSRDLPMQSNTITWKGQLNYNDHFYFAGLPPGTRFVDRSGLIERLKDPSAPNVQVSSAPMLLAFTDHRKWVGLSLDVSYFKTANPIAMLQEGAFQRAQAAYTADPTDLPESREDESRLAPFDLVLTRHQSDVVPARRFLAGLARWIAARRIESGRRSPDPSKLQVRIAAMGAAMAPHRSIGGAAVRLDRAVSPSQIQLGPPSAPGRWLVIPEIAKLAARDAQDGDWIRSASESHAMGLAAIIWQQPPDIADVLTDGVMRHRILLDGARLDFARLSHLIDFLDGITFDPMGATAEAFKARLKSYVRAVLKLEDETLANIDQRIDALDRPLDARSLPKPLSISVAFEVSDLLINRLSVWREIARALRTRLEASPLLRNLTIPFDAVPVEERAAAPAGAAFGSPKRIELLGSIVEQERGELRDALRWLRDQVVDFDCTAYEAVATIEMNGFDKPRVVSATQMFGESVGQHAARMQLTWILDDTFPPELEVYTKRADDVLDGLRTTNQVAKLALVERRVAFARDWWREGATRALAFSTVKFASTPDFAARIGRGLVMSALHASLLRSANEFSALFEAKLGDRAHPDELAKSTGIDYFAMATQFREIKNDLKQVAGIAKFDFIKYWLEIEKSAALMNKNLNILEQ